MLPIFKIKKVTTPVFKSPSAITIQPKITIQSSVLAQVGNITQANTIADATSPNANMKTVVNLAKDQISNASATSTTIKNFTNSIENIINISIPSFELPATKVIGSIANSVLAGNVGESQISIKKPLIQLTLAPLVTVTSTKSRTKDDVSLLIDKFKEDSKKFSSYENITGNSSQRPEILMLSEYKPIMYDDFNKQINNQYDGQNRIQGLNVYGDYIDIQLQVQNLHRYNVVNLLQSIKETDPNQKIIIEKREKEFFNSIVDTIKNINYLYGLARQIEVCKESFNIKSDKFGIIWDQIIKNYYSDYHDLLKKYFGSSKNYASTTPVKFLTKFGYQEQGINKFSNTKVYLQLLTEFKNLVTNFSSKFLNQSVDRQKNDFKSSIINTNIYDTYYNIGKVAADIDSPVYNDITKLNARSINSVVPQLSLFFDKIEKSFSFSTKENKVAFFASYLSKEFRYSTALSNKDTQKFLSQNYGYQVNTQGSNFDFIDFVIGGVGSKITDVFANTNQNSLSIISQIVDGNSLILPFENKYLELDGAIFTPGSEYLVDAIFEGATSTSPDGFPLGLSNIENYSKLSNKVVNKFSEFVDHFRFFYALPVDSFTSYFKLSFDEKSTLESPQKFIDTIYNAILDNKQTAKLDIANDPMSGLLNLAYKDKVLKSLLFMYLVISNSQTNNEQKSKILQFKFNTTENNDSNANNTHAALDKIIEEIQARVSKITNSRINNSQVLSKKEVNESSKTYSFSKDNEKYKAAAITEETTEITEENISNSLRNGSPSIDFLKSTINKILNSFTKNSVFVDTKTYYSDVNDSFIVAFLFELCLTVFDSHVNTRITDKFITKNSSSVGRTYYTITNNQLNTGANVGLVHTIIADELDLQLQSIVAITAIIRRLVNSSLTITNTLRSEDTVKVLNTLISILGSKKYLTHIMSEQQLILIKSLVDDVKLKLFSNKNSTELQITQQNLENKSNDLSILEDIGISENIRNAFFAFFSQDKFSSKKSFNSRIISVGVPNGFAKNIREKINVELLDVNYNKKQVDVINLVVYKKDVEYQDLIFKPQKFMFELSRFVLKNENEIKPIGIDSSLEKIIRSIPTRDYSIEIEDSKDITVNTSLEESDLFINPQYSFIADNQKYEMIKNHISSHFIEMYIRFLTGMNMNEYSFEFLLKQEDRMSDKTTLDEQFITQLIESRLGEKTKFYTKISDIKNPSFNNTVSNKEQTQLFNEIKTITNLGNMRTSITDPSYEIRKLLRPKEYERIFHIAVDPDDFEIDLIKTQETSQGREALAKLLKQGIVIDIDENTIVGSNKDIVNQRLKLVDRNPSENNFVFEKYFVTFETVLASTNE